MSKSDMIEKKAKSEQGRRRLVGAVGGDEVGKVVILASWGDESGKEILPPEVQHCDLE